MKIIVRLAAVLVLAAGCACAAVAAEPSIVFRDGRVEIVSGAEGVAPEKAVEVFRVMVDGAGGIPAMAGSYTVEEGKLVFQPAFPFSPGMRYRAEFGGQVVRHTVPEGERGEAARIAAIYPSADVLPENQLKFYLHFTEPMGRGYAYRHVRLRDGEGNVVADPFLELGEELWDPEGKRFTLFLDPGRVKRGLKPRAEIGPALEAGKRYALEVDAGWKDANGRVMAESFVKSFRAGEADYVQPNPEHWELVIPSAGTREPFIARFPESLDHGLLSRVVVVPGMEGEIVIGRAEREWKLVPAREWESGRHVLEIGTELEDLAGNSVREAFEVMAIERRVSRGELGEKRTLEFRIGEKEEKAGAENWPQWRGPEGNSVSRGNGLPVVWNGESGDGILWKAELPGDGASTPVAWGDSIFVTSQIGSGPVAAYGRGAPGAPEADGPVTFVVICLDRRDGAIRWEKRAPAAGELESVHPLHNLATPSCVTDGERVVAWFGTGQVFCYDFDGEMIWERDLGEEEHAFRLRWGHASSPVLHDGLLYLLCDHDRAACLLALDKKTGKEVWRVDRGSGLRSYSAPVVAKVGDRFQVIVNSNPGIDAYDASTGKSVWRWEEFCKVPVPLPTVAGGVMYASRGYTGGPLMAVELEGLAGEVSEDHFKWRWPSRAPYVSSPLVIGELMYLSNEEGQVYCVESETGEMIRAKKLGRVFWSSPLSAEGRIYLLDESGEVVVLAEGREMEVLARNRLPGEARGSPAVAGDRLLVRTSEALYCVGESRN